MRNLMRGALRLLTFLVLCSVAGAQGAKRANSVPELFNNEAAATDPGGIHTYSHDLIKLVVPEQMGEEFINAFSDRLAMAEQAAREGKAKLSPEANIARAFNDLMKSVGAPPSLTTTKESIHKFREHAASIKAFPALFSANRNGTNCNPGEAMFLLYLLISNSGLLSEQDLDSAQALTQMNSQKIERSFGVAHMEVEGSSVRGLIFSYSSQHSLSATLGLFNNLAGLLGF
jgi:hypothetical protein